MEHEVSEWTPADLPRVPSEFGRKVRELRKARGWTQADLVERLSRMGVEMHQTTLAKLEAGTRPTPTNEIWALASVFDVEYGSLLPPVGVESELQVEYDAALADAITAQTMARRTSESHFRAVHWLNVCRLKLKAVEDRMVAAGRLRAKDRKTDPDGEGMDLGPQAEVFHSQSAIEVEVVPKAKEAETDIAKMEQQAEAELRAEFPDADVSVNIGRRRRSTTSGRFTSGKRSKEKADGEHPEAT